ncbi:sulfotransferase [Psychromonas ingrahamii 37]|uniref:Sulfotransferase n=1 Tax=Psychromonas ingrahamii (strain DSM 17664 / CCUG 51855 / 37) TaxID=357804 RepID=A1SX53_PSYIN|nr:sulfotransferase [Psychromonas ingrahamii]ABM04068.1 sulfotransferase [Psychromonas ingrahamii 37]
MTPIFMIGTQRSGSNLLRLMLNQLSDIASPHPPHILERMFPLVESYGDLDLDVNYKKLIDDICRLVELNPVEWSGITFDRSKIKSHATGRSLLGVYAAIHDLYTESQGAKTWCCKSLANIKYINQIEEHFENPKYIYLYRDGRDVALSFQKAVVGEKHIYNIATGWSKTQKIALDFKKLIDKKRFFCISYEELTQGPEKIARSLCEFLGVEYVPEILEFHKSNEAKNAAKSSELWGNVTSPIITNNSRKFLAEMSPANIEIFESVSGNILDELGYERCRIVLGEEKIFSHDEIDSFNSLNTKMKQEKMSQVDEKDKQRRERQTELLKEIKNRPIA